MPLAHCQGLLPTAQPFSTPGTCVSGGEFFRTGDLTCVPCSNSVKDIVAEDGLSCRCTPGFYKGAASEFHCFPCIGTNLTTTADGLFCLECGEGTSFNPATRQCRDCSSQTEIFIDSLPANQFDVGTRSCVPCPLESWADETGHACVECGVDYCTQCDTLSGGVCLDLSPVSFPPNMFQFYAHNLAAAVDQCMRAVNTSTCQLVANLCVLRSYLRSDTACEQSVLLEGPHLPPLYYPQRAAAQVLSETEVRTRLLTKDGGDGSSTLPLVLNAFSLNGTFLGLDQELTQQIFLCLDRPSRSRAAWRVGVSYHVECSLTLSELTQRANYPIFYDLFLRDVDPDTGSAQLVPVPVLVTNYKTTMGDLVNEKGNIGRWQLVRRFHLAEAVTGDPQYVERMELIVQVTSGGINLPYLRLTYASWTPEDTSLPSSYTTQYTQSAKPLIFGLSMTISLLTVVVMVYAGVRANGFLRRSGTLFCEAHTFLYLCVEMCAGISTVIFILLTITSTFYLVFFKGQTVFIFMLPTGNQELVFEVLLGLALVFKVTHICYLMWHQCTIDIFFMDWERPKGLLAQNPDHVHTPTRTPVRSPVSIWRTYFVANEWNEIQSLRKINHSLLLVMVLLFIQVAGFGNLAELDPVSSVTLAEERYSAPPSDILRFSITALHFIIIAVALRLYVFLIHERYVEHKLHQFVDLCSVSNVSVFLTPHKLFGHYIHGRSVHGQADTNIREMNRNLHKEQNNMCGQRGLEVNSDLQTYEMGLTTAFRAQFDKILGPLRVDQAEGVLPTGNVTATQQRRRSSVMSTGEGHGLSETVIKAYEGMNHLLTSFCERSIGGLDYTVKNKLLPEKVLGIEFHDTENNSLFYRDPGYSFDRVLFYGHFWNLLLLDLLVFAVVDLVARNYVLATVITCIVSWAIDWIRDTLGRRNLAKKTLVDGRFLI